MARPRKYASEAEKQAAYRNRKAGHEGLADAGAATPNGDLAAMADEADAAAAEIGTPAGPADPGLGTVEWQGETWPILRRAPAGGEEAYVAEARRAAELVLAAGATNPIADGVGRLDRAERYATWRYRGWQAGQIDGL